MSAGEHGYDEEFVDIPADYLKCVVCQYVLRDPVLLITCGHHYCNDCFERVKRYSAHFASNLCCPIDRTIIDLSKVCKDICLARAISDLHVKCTFSNQGCLWVGELRDHEVHKLHCYYKVKDDTLCSGGEVGSCETREIINKMCVRLELCEQSLLAKEKDLAHIKFHLNDTKEKVQKKDKEIEELKQKMLECEKRNISNYHEIENLKVGRKLQGDAQQHRNNGVEKLDDVEGLKGKVTVCANKEIQPYETFETKLNNLKSQMEKTERDTLQLTKIQLDEGLGKTKDELQGLIKNIEESLSNKVDYQALDKIFYEIDGLRRHINHADVLIPSCCYGTDSFDTVFVWKIRDFVPGVYWSEYFWHTGGYRCELCFEDHDGDILSLYFILLVNGEDGEPIRDFGNISNLITIELLTKEYVDYDHEDCWKTDGYDKKYKLCDIPEAEYKKCILNDTLTISCTLT